MRLKPDMESYTCDYCHSTYFPEAGDDGVRVLGDPCNQDCPVCATLLVHAVLAKNPIVYCTGCKGMMVPMAMLEGLIEELRAEQGSKAAPAPPDKEDLQRKINCPQCHHPMDTHLYAGPGNAVISSCEDCSLIWMDRGVLLRIAHSPDAPRQSEPEIPDDPDSSPASSWNETGNRVAVNGIVDGIVDSFFR
jgi:Zn-finger nucleic acid-binding protein